MIYIVCKGKYSDRYIEAVFDNKEAAEVYIQNNQERERDGSARTYDHWDIEEWEVNSECPVAGRTPWRVDIHKDGTIEWIGREPDGEPESEEWVRIYVSSAVNSRFLDENKLNIVVNARNEEHAQKIAGERRAQHIAMGTWKDWRAAAIDGERGKQ